MKWMGHHNNLWDWTATDVEMETTSLEKKVATAEKHLDLTDRRAPFLDNFGYQFTHDLLMTWKRDFRPWWLQRSLHLYNKDIKDWHFGGSHQKITLHTGVMCCSNGQAESFVPYQI